MKVKFSIVLDIPDEMVVDEEQPETTLSFARQVVFDEFSNFAVTRHLNEAIEWRCSESPNKEHHVSWHRDWSKIINDALPSVKIEENFA
jgi:hypothetical protein